MFITPISISEDKNDTEIVAEFISEEFDLKQNEITRNLEKRGVAMKTRDLNSCYIDTKIALGDINVFRGDFDSILFSDRTPIYNPIIEFIKENEDAVIEEDLILKLSKTFKVDSEDEGFYNHLFVKKWFIGMVGTALKRGVSPLALVLCGDVHGTGKTEWYRRLLPNDLKSLYAESKLDAGKDDEILMTQKILIMDDEFGGKSKKDEKRFKEITSKKIFNLREPYGKANVDLERLATLCGTTNELAVLSDPTGNRRLLPILIKSINHSLYNSIDKDLLFIQAYREIEKGFDYNLTKEEIKLLNDSTSEFEQVDNLEELFQLYFSDDASYGNVEYLTNTEILSRVQNISNMKIGTSKRLGQIMKKLGFNQVRKKVNGATKRVYKVVSINKKYEDPFPHREPEF
jgi:predicted P-loop ATPase